MEKAIGGYFELELPPPQSIPHAEALCFQSARAAFLALLLSARPQRVWMPRYICDAMLAPLAKAGVELVHYAIDRQYDMIGQPDLLPGDWLLYVNYFGICSGNIDRLLAVYNPEQIILDCAQAFYAASRSCLASIYSPRKFFGVADGGLLVTDLPVNPPSHMDQDSFARSAHLLKRLALSPESGYADYIRAEQSLCYLEPCQMSTLSRRLLMSVNFEQVRKRRNVNFCFLHDALGDYNQLSMDPLTVDGPLCYPFLTDRTLLRERLIAERIFIPTYWPEVPARSKVLDNEHYLTTHCLPLPIDQRYRERDMQKIIDIILN